MVRMNKKGLEGRKAQITIFFGILAYIIVAAIAVLLLNIAGCLIAGKAEAAIDVNVDLSKSVRADSQLNSMLGVQMPDSGSLRAKLDWLMSSKNPDFSKKLDVDFKAVKAFLDKNPELYSKKDYSEFISGLQVIYASGSSSGKQNVEQTFRAVTAALFLRALNDYPKKGEYIFYLLPVGVDFSPNDLKPSNKADMCKDYDLCAQLLPSQIIPKTQDPFVNNYVPVQKVTSQAVQVIPLADYTLAKVEFRYYPEFASALPKA